MDITRIFTGSDGLNTVVDPVRLPFNPETAISSLAVAVNVKVDRTGRVSRRDGYSEIHAGNTHSLFCDNGPCVYVRDGVLYELLPDYSEVELLSGVSSRLDYAQAGNGLYFVGSQMGVIKNHTVLPWPSSPYVGQAGNKTFSAVMPSATHIAFYAGRIFLSYGSSIFFSQPFGFGFYDLTRDFLPFKTSIRMMKPVQTGLYISDERKTYFLSNKTPKEFELKEVMPYPALEWAAAIDLVDGMEIGMPDPGLYALWASEKGACAGGPQGLALNLTRDKVIPPVTAPRGASLLRGYEFIHAMGD